MKYWLIIVVFLLGIITFIIGALFKLMHWPNTSILLSCGAILGVLAIILLIIKLLTNKNPDSFLNK